MVKRSFFGWKTPKLTYQWADLNAMRQETIPPPPGVTLFLEKTRDAKGLTEMKAGDRVRTGQKIPFGDNGSPYVVSPVTGIISSLTTFTGDFGKQYWSLTLSTDESEEEIDPDFQESGAEPSLSALLSHLRYMPGFPPFRSFVNPDPPVHTVIINGADADLLVRTNAYIAWHRRAEIDRGVRILKRLSGAKHMVVAVPGDTIKQAGNIGGAVGAELRPVGKEYPNGFPRFIYKEVMGKPLPAGKRFHETGVVFFSAQAAAALGRAYENGRVPVKKYFTLVTKEMETIMVEARIGTKLSDVFAHLGIQTNDGDRIIIGGPMTGMSVYTEAYPVQPDTDAVLLQDAGDVNYVSDYPCINCGECVRICPADIPVSMLVRYIEATQYQDAADEYDLFSCIDCGQCALVCPSRIPIFQYIRLAKHELAKYDAQSASPPEESDA